MGTDPVVARAARHDGEEPCISGVRGSGAVFFAGCTLQCVFCQNAPISHGRRGKRITSARLAEIFDALAGQGVHNLNLVTATHFVPAVVEALDMRRNTLPVVYNCGGYEMRETIEALRGHVDVYLPDLKYLDTDLAARYSHAPDYPQRAAEAILAMCAQVGPPRLDVRGMLVRGVMVRHLVLPGHVENSLRVLDWMANHLRGRAYLSLMAQYTPLGAARAMPPIDRPLAAAEYQRVLSHLEALGWQDGYTQSLEASGTEMIPDFSLQGV
nr:radical SAM protein [Maliibacterium massiliense]